jgi:broad specificity phosphatase PhoE
MAPTEILLLRHPEKRDGTDVRNGFTSEDWENGKSLSIRGWQRAGALVALLAPNPLLGPRLPRPDRIYASAFRNGAGHSRRPEQTVLPLAQKLGLAVDLTWALHQERAFGAALAAEAGVALACWQHQGLAAWPAPSPRHNSCRSLARAGAGRTTATT